MRYLVTGKNGQLARAFIKRFEKQGLHYTAPAESELDITDLRMVADAVFTSKPDVIINCAAYNLVDKAEQDKGAAHAVNATGPQNLARCAQGQKAIIVHFGSDYVFDGLKETGLYTENDAVNPLNEYGKSKLAGEELVRRECERHLIFRLSWVFGEGQQNFIYKLRSWAGTSDSLKIACDEFSAPTYTDTVVDIAMKALNQGLTGRYHLTNTGFCSRYEWAKLILSSLGIRKFIRPVSMDTFNLPARRPLFSAMSNENIARMLNASVLHWEEAVISFLRESAKRNE